MPVLKQTSPTACGLGPEAAAPEDGPVGQHQAARGAIGGGIGRGHGRLRLLGFAGRARQVGQGKAGRGQHRRPMLGRDGPGLAPFADRLGADAAMRRRRLGTSEQGDDVFHGAHGQGYAGKCFPSASRFRRMGNFLPCGRGAYRTADQTKDPDHVTARPFHRRTQGRDAGRDAARVSTLRMVTAKLKDTDIAARPGPPVDEAGIIAMLRGMAKSRARERGALPPGRA